MIHSYLIICGFSPCVTPEFGADRSTSSGLTSFPKPVGQQISESEELLPLRRRAGKSMLKASVKYEIVTGEYDTAHKTPRHHYAERAA